MNKYSLFTLLKYLLFIFPLFSCSPSSTGARSNSNFNRFKTSAQAQYNKFKSSNAVKNIKTSAQAQYNKFKSSNAVKNIKTYGGAAVGAVGGGVFGVAKGGVKSIYHVGRATGNILQGNVKQAGKHLGYAIDAPLTKGFLGAQKGFALGKEGFSGQKIKNGLSKAGDKIKNTGIGLGQGFAEARNAFSRQNVKDSGFISTVGKGIDTVLVGGSQGYNTKSSALPFGWKAPIDGNKVNVKASEATQLIKKQSKFNNVLNGAKDSFKAGLTQFKDWTASLKTKKSPSQDVNSPSVPSINQGKSPRSEQLAKQPQGILKNPNNNPTWGNVNKVQQKVTFNLKNDATRSSSPDTLSKIGVETSPVIPPRAPSLLPRELQAPALPSRAPAILSSEIQTTAVPPREIQAPALAPHGPYQLGPAAIPLRGIQAPALAPYGPYYLPAEPPTAIPPRGIQAPALQPHGPYQLGPTAIPPGGIQAPALAPHGPYQLGPTAIPPRGIHAPALAPYGPYYLPAEPPTAIPPRGIQAPALAPHGPYQLGPTAIPPGVIQAPALQPHGPYQLGPTAIPPRGIQAPALAPHGPYQLGPTAIPPGEIQAPALQPHGPYQLGPTAIPPGVIQAPALQPHGPYQLGPTAIPPRGIQAPALAPHGPYQLGPTAIPPREIQAPALQPHGPYQLGPTAIPPGEIQAPALQPHGPYQLGPTAIPPRGIQAPALQPHGPYQLGPTAIPPGGTQAPALQPHGPYQLGPTAIPPRGIFAQAAALARKIARKIGVKSSFKWELIKDSAEAARKIFQSDPNLAATRVNGVKFIREPGSGKIFALASNKLHDNAIVGQGSFGVVKNAIDIDNPTASVVVKKPLRFGKYESHDVNGRLNSEFNLVPEASKLRALGLGYDKVDQVVRYEKDLGNGKTREKQYLPQIKVKGDQIWKTFENSIDPKEIKVAIDSGLQALDRLHSKGFIHTDAHLGNILFDKNTGKATLIDPGRLMEARKGTIHDPIYDKLNFLGNAIVTLSTKGTDAQSLKYATDKFIQLKYQRDPRLDERLSDLRNRVGQFLEVI